MDERLVIPLYRPYVPLLVESVHAAHEEYELGVLPAYQPRWARARPKMTHESIMFQLELRFDTDPKSSAFVRPANEVRVLYISGSDRGIGIRAKKLSRECLSAQHRSEQEDEWRRTGLYDCFEGTATGHVILGYRLTKELEPSILDISLSSERMTRRGQRYNDWRHVIWSAGAEGSEPAQPQTPPLFPLPPVELPPLPVVRAKRKRGGHTGEGRQDGTTNEG